MFFFDLVLTFSMSMGLTYLLRVYALKRNVIDVPNSRSSHVEPTPRGGGGAIVVMVLIVLVAYQFWLLFLAGFLVAAVGWYDDHKHVRSGIRLSIHIAGSALVLFSVGGMPQFTLLGVVQDWGLFGDCVAVLAIGWILNLFNFMDGIDGIAGVEVVTTTLISAALLFSLVGLTVIVSIHLFLAASTLGFLVWNWPPAKIFMGDAGSGFLGLILGALIVHSAILEPQMLWAWLIMLGVFVVDATVTLVRRLFRGERVYEAHRSHAYQYASRYFGSHRLITIAVLAINLFWLAPISWLVTSKAIYGAIGLVLAYLPLIVVALKFKAGEACK